MERSVFRGSLHSTERRSRHFQVSYPLPNEASTAVNKNPFFMISKIN